MGIRPEDMDDSEAAIAAYPDSVTEVDITLTEMMGAETYLYFQIEGIDMTARVNPRSTAKHGERIKLALDTNKIHLFDKDTEEVIIH